MNRSVMMAIEAVEKEDLISDDRRRDFGNGFVAGYEKAIQEASELVKGAWRNPRYEYLLPADAIRKFADDVLKLKD